nr:MAG TPA: Eco57I restriction-modification methylase [Bacteriophage sp.]
MKNASFDTIICNSICFVNSFAKKIQYQKADRIETATAFFYTRRKRALNG